MRVENNDKTKKYERQQSEYYWNCVGCNVMHSGQEKAQEMRDKVV